MLHGKPTFNDVLGGVLAVLGLTVVGYLAIGFGSEQAEGAIIGLVSAAVGWLYRGRIENPKAPEEGGAGAQSGPR